MSMIGKTAKQFSRATNAPRLPGDHAQTKATRSSAIAQPLASGEHRAHQVLTLQQSHNDDAEHVQANQDDDRIRGIGVGILHPPDTEEGHGDLHRARDRRDREHEQQCHQHHGARGIEPDVTPGDAATEIPDVAQEVCVGPSV